MPRVNGARAKAPSASVDRTGRLAPITALAPLGVSALAAIVTSSDEARSAPVPASVPEADPEIATTAHSTSVSARRPRARRGSPL